MSGITVGWGNQWDTLSRAVSEYYGQGVGGVQYERVAEMLNSGDYTMAEMEGILQQIPYLDRTYNTNGELISVSYNASSYGNTASGSAANAINSNAAAATKTQFSTVQNITKDQQTGKVAISDTVKKYNSGVASDAKALAGSAVAAVGAAAVGISLAKTIDSALYNANPDFWDERNMQALNPETWSSITAGDNSVGAKLFNWVFQIDDTTGNPTPYLDEMTFAYMAAYMASENVFSGDINSWNGESPQGFPTVYDPIYETTRTFSVGGSTYGYSGERMPTPTSPHATIGFELQGVPADYKITSWSTRNGQLNELQSMITSTSQIPNIDVKGFTDDGTMVISGGVTRGSYTFDNRTVYYGYNNIGMYGEAKSLNTSPDNDTLWGQVAWIMQYGTFIEGEGVEGITSQEGETQFDVTGISDFSDISEVLDALKDQFPELWDNRIEVSPDGERVVNYIPVGFPTGGTGTRPTTVGATKTDLAPDIAGEGQNATDELIKTLIDMLQNPKTQNGMESDTTTPTKPVDPNDNGMGVGNTPTIVLPTGSAGALYSIYNPSQGEINSFGSWLWSPSFVDQLLKLFNDPMQAIIGLHKIFATPSVSGRGNIKVGYLDSGVATNLVNSQYTEVDCGSVDMPEYFENALDYTDTEILLYLPFIGIVPINAQDVMRGSINVQYKVDVLTGACLASVNVYRDSLMGGQIYTYAGNCAVQYPLSSGSYMGIVTGILGVAGTIVGTVASGGAMLPMALGIGASALNGAKTKVQHSGSLGGNAGAMGIKTPYLIIRRPQTQIAADFRSFDGESNNVYGTLSAYSGFVRVKHMHLHNIPATDVELNEIENLLKEGVFI